MKKILLVEDDQALAMATSFALETENFNVTHCSCLADAKKALENDSFSLMLLDVNLPDGIGYTFCQEVRNQGCTNRRFLVCHIIIHDNFNIVNTFFQFKK